MNTRHTFDMTTVFAFYATIAVFLLSYRVMKLAARGDDNQAENEPSPERHGDRSLRVRQDLLASV